MAAKFPCCPGTAMTFRIEIIPVVIQAGVYVSNEGKYEVEGIQPKATIPDKVFREGLFSKEPEIKVMIEKYGTAVCPRCGKVHNLSEITFVNSCHDCGKETDIKFCKHRNIYLCKECSKDYPKCACNSDKCYTGIKRQKEG